MRTVKDVLNSIYMAPGILKNHHSHIYAKLKVRSREEMLLYISLLKKCGMIQRIFTENAPDKT